jgi:hypothetical protein
MRAVDDLCGLVAEILTSRQMLRGCVIGPARIPKPMISQREMGFVLRDYSIEPQLIKSEEAWQRCPNALAS